LEAAGYGGLTANEAVYVAVGAATAPEVAATAIAGADFVLVNAAAQEGLSAASAASQLASQYESQGVGTVAAYALALSDAIFGTDAFDYSGSSCFS
jgi:hypothetical protein